MEIYTPWFLYGNLESWNNPEEEWRPKGRAEGRRQRGVGVGNQALGLHQIRVCLDQSGHRVWELFFVLFFLCLSKLVLELFFTCNLLGPHSHTSIIITPIDCVCVLSCVAQWIVAHQSLLSVEFSREEYQSGLPFPTPGDLPNSGIEPVSLSLANRFFTTMPSGKQ